MAKNKVIFGNQVLLDLTGDTVTPEDVAEGVSFHDRSGEPKVGTASGGGHEMIPIQDDIETIADLEDGDDEYVANAYTIKRWSNCDAIVILGEASRGDYGIGVWNDDWKTDGIRTGWLWSPSLYEVLAKSVHGVDIPVHDIEIIPVFDNSQGETISLYAYRIDDDVTIKGEHGGAIAFKFNNEIQSKTIKVGVKLVHQRTNVEYVTPLS